MDDEQQKVWDILSKPCVPPSVWDDFDINAYMTALRAKVLTTSEVRALFYKEYMSNYED